METRTGAGAGRCPYNNLHFLHENADRARKGRDPGSRQKHGENMRDSLLSRGLTAAR
jgi:hypothetical protein